MQARGTGRWGEDRERDYKRQREAQNETKRLERRKRKRRKEMQRREQRNRRERQRDAGDAQRSLLQVHTKFPSAECRS